MNPVSARPDPTTCSSEPSASVTALPRRIARSDLPGADARSEIVWSRRASPEGGLKTLTPTSLATSHLGRKRLFMKPIDPLRAHSQENFAAGVSTAREPALLQQASLPLRGAELALEEKHALVEELAVKHGPAAAAFPAVAGSQRGRYPGCDSRGISASAAGAEPRNDPRGRGLHLHLVYARRPDDPARHPPAAP